MDELLYLTNISIILLFGILFSILSRKLKIPNMLFLLLLGIVLNHITYAGEKLIEFPSIFVSSIGILTLAMVVFDSSSRFKLKDFDTLSFKALRIVLYSLVLNVIILSFAAKMIFGIQYSFLVFLFAALMAGTDCVGVLSMFKNASNQVIRTLEIESVLNTPIIVLIPFIIIDAVGSFSTDSMVTEFLGQVAPFLQQIISGIGAGILVGIIVFKFMRKYYSGTLSPIAIIAASLFTYVLAENLGGNGVLAVTTMGLFFGHVSVKEKDQLQDFSSIFAKTLQILVFVLIGLSINFPIELGFIIKSLLLFAIYIIIRWIAVELACFHDGFTYRERIFMALNTQKGIAVAVVALALSVSYVTPGHVLYNVTHLTTVLNLILSFILYSIVLSTIVFMFNDYLLQKLDPEPKTKK